MLNSFRLYLDNKSGEKRKEGMGKEGKKRKETVHLIC